MEVFVRVVCVYACFGLLCILVFWVVFFQVFSLKYTHQDARLCVQRDAVRVWGLWCHAVGLVWWTSVLWVVSGENTTPSCLTLPKRVWRENSQPNPTAPSTRECVSTQFVFFLRFSVQLNENAAQIKRRKRWLEVFRPSVFFFGE